jgi:hypothetical protein
MDASAKKYLKTAVRFATHRWSRARGHCAAGGGRDAPALLPGEFPGAKKSSRGTPLFAPQHPICAKSRADAACR